MWRILIGRQSLNNMLNHNPYFTQESFKKITTLLTSYVNTLIYDGSDDGSNKDIQIRSGKELREVLWIFATIIDHIFDYKSYLWYLADNEESDYLVFKERFIQDSQSFIDNAITRAPYNFNILGTVTRNSLNQHRIPKRDIEKEQYLLEALDEIQKNNIQIVALLKQPKYVSDPEKPPPKQIKGLFMAIRKVISNFWALEDRIPADRLWEVTKGYELFLNPLYLAWRVYEYGWHTDFMEEGQSMSTYMFFAIDVEKHIRHLIHMLETDSPFARIEKKGLVTNELVRVYRHLLTQDWRSKI